MSLLEVKDLCRTFWQGDTAIHAVDHVNFSLNKGEMLAIVGQSGSGKTTLLNLLDGVDKPTSGQVLLDGQDIHSLSDKQSAQLRRRKIGYIYQDFKLLPILTAKENILLPANLDKRKIPADQVQQLADQLGIGTRLGHLPSQMSGGQRQRVAIARALINQPDILLADEPTGNLDKASAQEIIQLLLDLNKAGHTIILVTHDEQFARLCPRKITLSDGQIVADLHR
jgi:putative ABC transport system ATP-binding protein